ncbi:outer membrane lipoprotein-sorting protein [Rhodoferax sp.]|uniref:outer membrane lipoprotein-sorting protein n=1 Tax=Rhodoferax sp. TaxID=50421 RepID=UPI0027159437|nr:outer membrane lipoprotein-sorting protein [Rhodoferax sp.]MDO9199466.1 outer membrane lipoprotein-sorting protein [Rhodoferax sp.]
MKLKILFFFSLLLGLGSVSAAPNAEEILAASDAIRNPGRPFSVTVTLTEFQAGKQVDTSTLTSYSRTQQQGGQFASLIRFVLPARDAGKLMLKNGNELWFYDPTNKASVRLSPQQRLLGQASNGDVVTVNFSKDYKATLVGDEEIQDGERRTRKAHKLALVAEAPDVTYASIEMWVDTENNRPLKARFFAESSRLLKTAYYRRFQSQLGAERPTETVIIDGLNPQSVTIMRFSDYKARVIPDTWMQRDFLPRFQPD